MKKLIILISIILFTIGSKAQQKIYHIVFDDFEHYATYVYNTYSLDTVAAYYQRTMNQTIIADSLFTGDKHFFESRNEYFIFYVEEKWAIKKKNGKIALRRIKDKRNVKED